MGYRPNTKQYSPGDKVLHRHDAKKPRMFIEILDEREVIGGKAYYKCKYVNAHFNRRYHISSYDLFAEKDLYDPELFNLHTGWPKEEHKDIYEE